MRDDFSPKTFITFLGEFPQAGNASSWPRTLYWLLVFSVFFGLTLQGLVSVVLDYYSHPFDTGTELNHESSVDFPAITLCNLNRINCVNLMTERIDLRNTVRDRA